MMVRSSACSRDAGKARGVLRLPVLRQTILI